MVKPNVDTELRFLLTKTQAYDDVKDQPAEKKHAKTKHRIVKEMLQRWRQQSATRRVWKLGQGWKTYVGVKGGKGGGLTARAAAITQKLDPNNFKFHPSHEGHTEIQDAHGVTAAYRIRLPSHFIDTLTKSSALLKRMPMKNDKRG